MKKKAGVILLMAVLAAVMLICHSAGQRLLEGVKKTSETSGRAGRMSDQLVVLDPGHGGMDCGKQGVNGIEEKEVNLKISLQIKEILKKENIDVVLTREDDDRLADTQRADLEERVSIMNTLKPDLAVSIHQNSYSDAGVKGAQVFYYEGSEAGEEAAGAVQEKLNQIDPKKAREVKANSTYYILKNADVPVIIAECGFLSNPEEAELLAEEEYQRTVAEAVASGVVLWLNGK
ncbi:N-acetylmuramoyl-L-alanine amidase [Ruminococcus sp. CLA-AA-H200]|uniref:N-acetylmuramoyl-L-alanine amidase n=1 Tax=Ruminococcus turbiniformis TaxID=2881258 RepID=A0ABS8G088_9FIRM|nr:N-acetylmuramoyl-L-alanine amidase [Ruminococcus turbiniformis]MCC2255304.1 N-acetylmuramoyl-L-alanine amidase [Ruminococcus turbiniformis]